jgi:organic hydroperoxide reductase OsmC/OhrA
MSGKHEYVATVAWQRREGEKYTDNRYSRAHEWRFDGGAIVPASSSPSVVPAPLSDPGGVDPEEAFVASLSSCHMLFFLFHAAKKGFVVDRYEDEAVGTMGKNAKGAMAMLKVVLRPAVTWDGDRRPSGAELDALHEQSHHDCFIANSVTTEISVEPRG